MKAGDRIVIKGVKLMAVQPDRRIINRCWICSCGSQTSGPTSGYCLSRNESPMLQSISPSVNCGGVIVVDKKQYFKLKRNGNIITNKQINP
jgi:hypothetical protein